MSTQDFKIHYNEIPDVSLPTKEAMRDYLNAELEVWHPLLNFIKENLKPLQLPFSYSSVSHDISESLTMLLESLEKEDFSQYAKRPFEHRTLVPPPSKSVDGQFILRLFNNGLQYKALGALLNFFNEQEPISTGRINHSNQIQSRFEQYLNEGEHLLMSARTLAALPLEEAVRIRLDQATGQAVDLLETLKKQEKTRREEQTAWHEAEKKLADYRQAEYQKLVDLFHEQLKLRAPVKLWAAREELHSKKSKTAFVVFFFLAFSTAIAGALMPWILGEDIAKAFVTEICDSSTPPVCSTKFSAQGPLIISGLLIASSILLWLIRLQYRVHLSERHLSLDASEKKAFAETFLAMKEGADVSAANETIILQSLFRPTQDGIIKDDESGFDFSAAALLAKQLGRDGK